MAELLDHPVPRPPASGIARQEPVSVARVSRLRLAWCRVRRGAAWSLVDQTYGRRVFRAGERVDTGPEAMPPAVIELLVAGGYVSHRRPGR